MNYAELDLNAGQEFGRSDEFFVSFGLSPGYLISNSNQIDIDSKFDIRGNTMIGYKLSEKIDIYFQGKISFLKLNKVSEIKSYLLSLNTSVSIF